MKRAAFVLLALAGILVLLAAATFAWLRTSLPVLDGDLRAPGLQAPVRIVRDAEGVPHVFAAGARDGWFAMGYVHAQDRLWQMEFQRRVAQGRLSEFLGEKAFETDVLFRTLGIAATAKRIFERLDPGTRANLEAYAAGVNAELAAGRTLPPEFQAFRIRPGPWKPEDSIEWLLVMAWDLSSNWKLELARLRFTNALGEAKAAQFMPGYPGDHTPPWPDLKALYAELRPQADALLAMAPPVEGAIGSNSWVVSGAHAGSGRPLLANDPHLGLQAPALWYLAHVATPQGNVVGATLPGIPFVVLGHNDFVAWSMTTTNGDTQDLFVEKVVPGDPGRYVTPTGTARFESRDEVIRVGSEARHVRIRSTRHGPVLSDAVKAVGGAAPAGHVLALAWTALTPTNATARAGFELNAASTHGELMQGLRDFQAPQQNVVFAERDGRIGFVAPGLVPVRRADNAAMGRVPVPGWDAKYDWQGMLPFEELPSVIDPPSGRIVTANHKITPPGYKPFISVDWFPPYRADRIEALLDGQPLHTLDSFARIQADSVSFLAGATLPFALAAEPLTDGGRVLQARLLGWNGDMAADSKAALAFAAWYRELTRLVYADELGDLFTESWDMRAAFMLKVLNAEDGLDAWCDNITTPQRETCAYLASQAFDLAAQHLDRRYGHGESLQWGDVHFAAGDHRPFGFVPVLKRFFDVNVPAPGDTYSVNVGHYFIRDPDRPFADRHGPSLRAIYDLADLDRSRFMQSTGQSGNVFSPWYSSFAERWARVEYITIPTNPGAITPAHTLTLRP
ncbi:MAG TPA: penicillin acylase family protein [Usitatibacter sp.]|jgi:penicillin amidase|nr:penicillin acylase family protein [Usitatibacter sp.]